MNENTALTPLNMDILLVIISHSPPKTATSIIATCRFLYHEGAKVILQKPVFLDGSEQDDLRRLRFIQAEDLSRCSYVRNLSIMNVFPVSGAVGKILVDVVPRMSNLVNLLFNGDRVFQLHPYLIPAFASLRLVKKLVVCGAGAQSCELLRILQSELVSASVVFAPTSLNNAHPSTAYDHPLHLLRRSASTLRTLTLSFWHDPHTGRDPHTGIETTASYPQVIYPGVRDLVLHREDVKLYLPPFIRALPNLVHLKVEGDHSLFEEFSNLRHFRNEEPQTNVTRRRPTKGSPVWKHIQTFTGAISDLLALGMSFPIPRLYLTALRGRNSALALTEVLADLQPMHLTIAYEDQPFSHTLSPDFLTALHSDAVSRLRSLALTVDLMAADIDSDFDVGEFWASVETALKRLPLRDLCIVMCDISLPEAASMALPPSDGGEPSFHPHYHADGTAFDPVDPTNPASVFLADCPQCSEAENRMTRTLAERTLQDFDVSAFVGRLAASIPTFQNALVSIAGPSRWGGGMRTELLGKHEDLKSKMRVKTHDDVKETDVVFKQTLLTLGLAHETRWYSSIARAWYRSERGWSRSGQ